MSPGMKILRTRSERTIVLNQVVREGTFKQRPERGEGASYESI